MDVAKAGKNTTIKSDGGTGSITFSAIAVLAEVDDDDDAETKGKVVNPFDAVHFYAVNSAGDYILLDLDMGADMVATAITDPVQDPKLGRKYSVTMTRSQIVEALLTSTRSTEASRWGVVAIGVRNENGAGLRSAVPTALTVGEDQNTGDRVAGHVTLDIEAPPS